MSSLSTLPSSSSLSSLPYTPCTLCPPLPSCPPCPPSPSCPSCPSCPPCLPVNLTFAQEVLRLKSSCASWWSAMWRYNHQLTTATAIITSKQRAILIIKAGTANTDSNSPPKYSVNLYLQYSNSLHKDDITNKYFQQAFEVIFVSAQSYIVKCTFWLDTFDYSAMKTF